MVVTVLEDGVEHACDGGRVCRGKIRVVVGVEGWCGSVARGLTWFLDEFIQAKKYYKKKSENFFYFC
jgi:hypothetical protein